MRIIQIIDSLEAGGAERMAVNYANALADRIVFSGLVVSRKQGALSNQVSNKVSYLFLNKKSSFDLKALFQLRKFVKQNRVEVVHAHGTSFFFTFLLKMTCPSIQLIWHDHYGDSEFLSKRPTRVLKMTLPFFKGIIVVNQNLKVWVQRRFHFENVIYLPNFPSEEKEVPERTVLKGLAGKRILCLSNLRAQKNHFLLLEVAKKGKASHPEWTFHLVGKDFGDAYSAQLRHLIVRFELENTVFIYGSRQDIQNILEQATIGILTSQSEGLPVALLEYGLHSKPVVVTAVGEIPLVIQNGINGFLVAPQEEDLFYGNLVLLMEDLQLQSVLGKALHQTILEQYSEEAVLQQYTNWLTKSCK